MIFYRVGNIKTRQGLWYDFDGNFTGLIHKEFDFCQNKDLQMPFDAGITGWLSATLTLDELFTWVPIKDMLQLQEHGYVIEVHEAFNFRMHNGHWVIKQDESTLIGEMKIL
ncbi:MAG: hypothetical protein PHS04_09855 [Tissierellia bacterium]|nr:hypothetical protein [Tissierellia bacterium]